MNRIVKRGRRGAALLLLSFAIVAGSGRVTHAAAPQGGQGGFEVVDPSQQTERIPAAPLLITAYAFVWVAFVGYGWTLWRRVDRVERDLLDLHRRLAERNASSSPRR